MQLTGRPCGGASISFALLDVGAKISGAGEERVPKCCGQRGERRRSGLEGLEEAPHAEVERGVVAAVPIEGALGADGAGLEKHASRLDVAGEARIVERDGVPGVAGVHVHAGVQEVVEAVEVAGARCLEYVASWDLLERDKGVEVLRVEVEVAKLRLQFPPRAARGRVHGEISAPQTRRPRGS